MKKEKKIKNNQMREEEYKVLHRDFWIINISGLIGGLVMFVALLLQRYGMIPMLPCALHDIMHLYCPGCGGTRALFAMLHGHLWQSFCYNPALLLGTLLILYYELGVIVTLVKKNGKCYYYRKGTIVYLYLIFLGVFTIVRNVLLVACKIDMLGDFL